MSRPERFEGLTFTVTDEHVKLMRRAYVDWETCEYGAPSINCKRPYGNSSVQHDIYEILGWALPPEADEDGYIPYDDPRARKIHEETWVVLQIVLRTGELRAGTYKRSGWADWIAQ